MMGWYHDGMGWAGWLVMVAGMVAFWGLVVWAVIALFRNTQTPTGDGPGPRDPLGILEERFARPVFQLRGGHRLLPRTSKRVRSESPTRFSDSTVRNMAMEGMSTTCGASSR